MSEQNDCILLKVSDIFDELSQENKRLNYELFFANNCLNVLNKLKTHLNQIHEKYETTIDSEDKQEFNELTQEFNTTLVSYDPNFEIIDSITDKVIKHKTKTTTDYNEDNVKKKTRRVSEQLTVEERRITTSNENNVKLESNSEIQNEDSEQLGLTPEERKKCFDPITNSYICPKPNCNKRCVSSRHLYFHLHQTHQTSKGDIECGFPGCSQTFRLNSRLRQHMKIHSGIKPFVCDTENCDYKCVTRYSLNVHKRSHLEGKPFTCSVCNKSFKKASSLKYHSLKEHTNELHYKCTVEDCHKSFPVPWLLYNHKKRDHLGEKKVQMSYPCDWPECDYEAPLGRLNMHKLLHTGEKPYVCEWPQCGKRFRLKASLRDHQNIHKNVRPHVCHWPGCGYRSSNSGNLVKHFKLKHKYYIISDTIIQ